MLLRFWPFKICFAPWIFVRFSLQFHWHSGHQEDLSARTLRGILARVPPRFWLSGVLLDMARILARSRPEILPAANESSKDCNWNPVENFATASFSPCQEWSRKCFRDFHSQRESRHPKPRWAGFCQYRGSVFALRAFPTFTYSTPNIVLAVKNKQTKLCTEVDQTFDRDRVYSYRFLNPAPLAHQMIHLMKHWITHGLFGMFGLLMIQRPILY